MASTPPAPGGLPSRGIPGRGIPSRGLPAYGAGESPPEPIPPFVAVSQAPGASPFFAAMMFI